MKRALQSGATSVEQSIGAQHSPYLTSDECADYLRFRTVKTFRNWLNTAEGQRLPKVWRGGVMLFDVRLIDALLRAGKLRAQQSVARRFRVVRHADESEGDNR